MLESILTKFLGHSVPPAIRPLTDHPQNSSPTHEGIYLDARRCVGSLSSTRDKANSQYISEMQSSPYKPVL